jgi:hypothetical protein
MDDGSHENPCWGENEHRGGVAAVRGAVVVPEYGGSFPLVDHRIDSSRELVNPIGNGQPDVTVHMNQRRQRWDTCV